MQTQEVATKAALISTYQQQKRKQSSAALAFVARENTKCKIIIVIIMAQSTRPLMLSTKQTQALETAKVLLRHSTETLNS